MLVLTNTIELSFLKIIKFNQAMCFNCEIVQCIVTKFRILLVGVFIYYFCMKSNNFQLKFIYIYIYIYFLNMT